MNFTDQKFTYHRRNVPIMFNIPTKQEKNIWESSILRTTRDFFKITRKLTDLDCDLIMDCGLSLGEFSIYLVFTAWAKRMQV